VVSTALRSDTRMARRPYRTPRQPQMVNQDGACEILGVNKMTLHRWRKPGSGKMESSHPPDNTYMLPPQFLRGPGGKKAQPYWVQEDVERFAADIGRMRAPAAPRTVSEAS
jgi:nitrous oxide reductase accessory protein NosL